MHFVHIVLPLVLTCAFVGRRERLQKWVHFHCSRQVGYFGCMYKWMGTCHPRTYVHVKTVTFTCCGHFLLSRGEYPDLSPAQITFYVVSKPHTRTHSPSSILVSGSCARSRGTKSIGDGVCVILAALLCNFQRDGAINETRKQVHEHNRPIIKACIERTSTTPELLLLMRASFGWKKSRRIINVYIDRFFQLRHSYIERLEGEIIAYGYSWPGRGQK